MSVVLNKEERSVVNIQRDLVYLGKGWHRSMYAEAPWVCR